MTVKKGYKRIEIEVKKELLQKWDDVARILGFSRIYFIKNAIDKYIINIFETIKPICEESSNINTNLMNIEYPTMICPICNKEIDKRGSNQHIKYCKKEDEPKEDDKEDLSITHDPKIISKEKRDRLKLEKKYNDVGRDGKINESIP